MSAKIKPNVVLEPDHLVEVVGHFLKHDKFAFDVESVDGEYPNTRGVPSLNKVTWLSMATHGITAVIPMGHPLGTKIIGERKEPRTDKNGTTKLFRVPVYEPPPAQMRRDQVFEILRPLFFREDITKIAHEITFDVCSTAKYFGEVFPGPYEDTKMITRLIDENTARSNNGLKKWIERTYGVTYDMEDVGKCVEKHPFDTVAHYSYMDSLYDWLLYLRKRPLIDTENLQRVYQVEQDLISCLCGMRLAGNFMDVPRLEETRDEITAQLVVTEGRIYKAAGKEFNINSPAQKTEILYASKEEGGQGLKPWRLTGTGQKLQDAGKPVPLACYSTDAVALETYSSNTVARELLEYADGNKMLNTYVNAWLGIPGDKKHPSCIYDGYIYPEFQQHGTVTGRFSGRAPNPQNIPRADTPRGLLIRGAFSSPEGWCRVVSDYGQIELVMLAHLIGRGKLFEGFLAGIDPHTVHAAGVLGKDPADVTKDERQKYGKTLGFTVINGAHWKKVAELIGGTQKEAKWILDKHEAEFPEVYAFKEAVFNGARSRRPPHVRSLLGRKRRMPGLMSSEFRVRSAAERETFNFLIQGGAADLMKVALIAADNMLAERVPEAYINMTVHDEMTAMCRIEDVEETKATIVEAMTGPHIQRLIKVPLKVDCNAAQRWSDAH